MTIKTAENDVPGLLKSFYKLLFISLGISVFLSYLIFFIPLNATFVQEQENYYRNEVDIKASSSDHMIMEFISNAESLGSRTVIRQKLADYHSGLVNLKELKEFTQPKYNDGASVIRGLVGAGRYLPDGTPIAVWGDRSVYAKHAETAPGLYLVDENAGLFTIVVSSMQEHGIIIGYDACVFNANMLLENESATVSSYSIQAAGSTTALGQGHLYSVPIYQGRYLLSARPDDRIFKDATRKAFYFVTMYSCTLFVFISIFSYFTFYRFVKRIIDDHVRLIVRADGLLAEKELVLKEAHHRIKNNMNTISSLLSLQAGAISDPTAVMALEDAGNRIHSMSLLYDKLYRSPDHEELSVKDYLSSLVDEIVANFPNSPVVTVEKQLEDFVLDAKRLQPLGIIVNELITNSMKYAFRGRTSGRIVVSAAQTTEQIVVSIQDDGVGFFDGYNPDKHSGFGLELVDGLAGQLHGTIRMEREHGTKTVLEFTK